MAGMNASQFDADYQQALETSLCSSVRNGSSVTVSDKLSQSYDTLACNITGIQDVTDGGSGSSQEAAASGANAFRTIKQLDSSSSVTVFYTVSIVLEEAELTEADVFSTVSNALSRAVGGSDYLQKTMTTTLATIKTGQQGVVGVQFANIKVSEEGMVLAVTILRSPAPSQQPSQAPKSGGGRGGGGGSGGDKNATLPLEVVIGLSLGIVLLLVVTVCGVVWWQRHRKRKQLIVVCPHKSGTENATGAVGSQISAESIASSNGTADGPDKLSNAGGNKMTDKNHQDYDLAEKPESSSPVVGFHHDWDEEDGLQGLVAQERERGDGSSEDANRRVLVYEEDSVGSEEVQEGEEGDRPSTAIGACLYDFSDEERGVGEVDHVISPASRNKPRVPAAPAARHMFGSMGSLVAPLRQEPTQSPSESVEQVRVVLTAQAENDDSYHDDAE